jgi:polyferredoxin
MKRTIFPLLLAVLGVVRVGASERFPRPDFSGGYRMPVSDFPGSGIWGGEWLDVGVLALCLALAAYLALARRSRRGMLALTVFSLAYFGFVRRGCVCSVGSFQNVAEALWNPGVAVPASVLFFFALPLLAALLFGRVFCAGVCPLGAIQELVAWRPRNLPRWATECLRIVPRVLLGLAVLLAATGTAYLICRKDPFIALFRFSGPLSTLLVGIGLLVVGVFVARPYCRFICPYGVLLAWMSRLSWRHLSITPDECVVCGLCEDACPVDAIEPATAAKTGETRRQGIRGLVVAAVLIPVLVGIGTWAGGALGKPLVRLHEDWAMADQLAAEDGGANQTAVSKAFRNGPRSRKQLDEDVAARQARLSYGGRWVGAFLGLVIGMRLLSLRIRWRREGYEPDRADCVSCGRCFAFCPRERIRENADADG